MDIFHIYKIYYFRPMQKLRLTARVSNRIVENRIQISIGVKCEIFYLSIDPFKLYSFLRLTLFSSLLTTNFEQIIFKFEINLLNLGFSALKEIGRKIFNPIGAGTERNPPETSDTNPGKYIFYILLLKVCCMFTVYTKRKCAMIINSNFSNPQIVVT